MASPPSGCLVLMCGHPSSGKSVAAADISARLTSRGATVLLVDEPSLHLPRNTSYRDARSEKNTRSLLKATVERSVHKDGPVVILDANNGIKGYRYELWCIARQAGVRFCVVYVETPEAVAKAWNEGRKDRFSSTAASETTEAETTEKNASSLPPTRDQSHQSFGTSEETSTRAEWGGYDDDIFTDLVCRFEPPDGKNRWDAPLWRLRLEEEGGEKREETAGAEKNTGHENNDDVDPATLQLAHGFPKPEVLDGYSDIGGPSRNETIESAVFSILGLPDQHQKAGGGDGTTFSKSCGILRVASKSASTQPTTRPSDASLRADVDSGAQDIIDAIVKFDKESGGGAQASGKAIYDFGPGVPILRCEKAPSLQILRKLKRQFLKNAAPAVSGDKNGTELSQSPHTASLIAHTRR
jgi:protein KTI12